MRKLNKALLTSLFLLFTSAAFAQDTVEMADKFRADGKIYVVVSIILIILIGLFVYLFRLDSKLTKLEKQLGKRN